MSQGWHLGGRWYTHAKDLGSVPGGCSWLLLKEDDGGSRWAMQRWSPRLTDRELDQVREVYLQRFTDAEAVDPLSGRFGFDDTHAWFLQKLQATPLAEAWPQWSQARRGAFLERLRQLLKQDLHPRLLHPEVISLHPGRVFIPRVIGEPPWTLADLEKALLMAPGAETGPGLWESPLDLSDPVAQPIRGRGQELTYLKSLMFGLATPSPMERVIVLQGEEGMGLNRLGDWCVAAAETESIWARSFELQPEETAGVFLSRMLQSLLKGFEADLYAQAPETARLLARRFSSFAFLRGGLRLVPDAPLEPGEVGGMLKVLEFLAGIHPRVILIHGLERADEALQAALGELVVRSELAWILCFTLAGTGSQAKGLITPLRSHPSVAFVHLNRLEDHDLLDLMDDLLQPNALPREFREEVCQASLGNPGLLRGILETAQSEGLLRWRRDTGWSLAPDRPASIRLQEDLAGRVLSGRMHRLGSAPMALLRLLALAEQPLDVAILGPAMGIAGDPLDEALRMATSLKLVAAKGPVIQLSNPRVAELALDSVAEAERQRMARSLLKALGDESSLALTLHLESLVAGKDTLLDRIMHVAEQDPPAAPEEAEPIVLRAQRLRPSPVQQARLWEFLADSWSQAPLRNHIPAAALGLRSPYEIALEALERACSALSESGQPAREHHEQLARLYRKEAFLRLKVRDFSQASRALQRAAECLADRPLHPEQPPLRLALGRVHLMQGYLGKGVKALEEGLQLISTEGFSGGRQDHMALLLELGKAQAERCQFQRALTTLHSAQRLMEYGKDYRRLAKVLSALSQIHLAIGQPEAAYGHLREALQVSRYQEDLELQGRCHLRIGIFKSRQQALGSALSHLDSAQDRFTALHDRTAVAETKAWKARTVAALGDAAQAEILLLQAMDIPREQLSAGEWGDLLLLQAEIAAFRNGWRDAARLCKEAVQCFEGAGLLWRERLARLRHTQALAHQARHLRRGEGLNEAWSALEQSKAQVEGTGSRWLDLEWHRAHALLLCALQDTSETVTMESITALGAMLAAAREMRFPAEVIEASALSAVQLLQRGEHLGARSRLQDAFSSFQEIWSKVPESMELSFQGRPDIHQFRQIFEGAGLRFILPERLDPLVDWTPTQVTMPVLNLR